MMDCATRLTQAKDVLHNRITGQQEKSVNRRDRRIEFFDDMSINDIKQYISELEVECGNGASMRRGSVGFYG